MEQRNEILEVLGHLSVSYSMADETVTKLAVFLLQCRDIEIARYVTEGLELSRKIERARWLLDRYTQQPAVKETVAELRSLLEDIKVTAARRNEIVHAHIDWNALTETAKFGLINPKKRTKVDLDVPAITILSIQMAQNAVRVEVLTYKLLNDLGLNVKTE
jgi:hypothetical protein